MKPSPRSSLLAALLLALALPAAAQAPGKAPSAQPVPPPPPPAAGFDFDPAIEPQTVIIKRGTDTVEEYRIGGRLYMMKVTPAHGVPYYLVDREGYGSFTRDDTYVGNNVRPPMWVIFSW